MIATVTLNPALDKTMVVAGFAVGRTNRAEVERLEAGGKGINVAQAARRLGSPVTALGFMAAGDLEFFAGALKSQDILTGFVAVPGKTRINLKVRDPLTGSETEINEPGFPVSLEQLEQLERKVRQAAPLATVMVFSGSLPPGAPPSTYARLIELAQAGGARTILDTGGEALRCGVAARPDLIKPNRVEAEELLGRPLETEAELAAAARELLALGPGTVVISLGAEGALAASPDQLWRARPPAIHTASSVAAGDAMVAALACAMLKAMPLGEALRLATAAGTATALASGSCVAALDSIQTFLPHVRLEELPA